MKEKWCKQLTFPDNSLLLHLPGCIILQSEHPLASVEATADTKKSKKCTWWVGSQPSWQQPPTELLGHESHGGHCIWGHWRSFMHLLCFLRTQSFQDSGLPTALRLTGPSLAQIHHISPFTETHHLLRAHLLPSREDIGHQFSFSSATWSEDGQRQEPRSHFSLFSGGNFYSL